MKFKKIYIEITNICNLNCSFCSNDSVKKREMTLDEFEHILKKIDKYTDYIYLHVKGEPLIHSKLDEILDLCDKYKKHVNITTNGVYYKERFDIINNHRSIRQINISLHSENNKDNYLEDILDVSSKLSDRIIINYRFWTLNNYKLDKKSTETVNKIINFYKISTDVVDKIFNDKDIKISNNTYIGKDNLFVWPNLNNEYYNEIGKCMGLNTHIGILVDGTVIPCCLDSSGIINLGNIYNEELENILNKDICKEIINNFKNNRSYHELCKRCSFKDRFND